MTLFNPVQFAIPAFIVLMIIEIGVARRRKSDAYETKDTAISLAMGFGSLLSGLIFGFIGASATLLAYSVRLFDIGYDIWAFVVILFLEDFIYYWYHRFSHECRFWWASHVNHHTSMHYNLSTALRQTWSGGPACTWLFWVGLAFIGFPPPLIAFQKGISLVYQFWVHTEQIDKLPRWIEAVFNTPSHHRVHHATNPRYLDRNYAGIFIIWDRLFGTFVPEDKRDPCRYGIVKNLGTFNLLTVAFHEWIALAKDVVKAHTPGEAFKYVFGPPGWRPDGQGMTSKQIRAKSTQSSGR